MESTARVIVDKGDGKLEGQPAGDFGVLLLTQAPIKIHDDGVAKSVAQHFGDLGSSAYLDVDQIPGTVPFAPLVFSGALGNLSNGQTVFPIAGGYAQGSLVVSVGAFTLDPSIVNQASGTSVTISGLTFTAALDTVVIRGSRRAGLGSASPETGLDILLAIIDSLPPLPADPSGIPDAGGLFKNGDANGYTLTRILPKAP